MKFQELTRALNRWGKVHPRAEKAEEALAAARAALERAEADDHAALAASVRDGTKPPARTTPEREADLADAERMASAARRACTQELDEVAHPSRKACQAVAHARPPDAVSSAGWDKNREPIAIRT